MPGVAPPPVFEKPFAADAAGPYITNPIPVTAVDPGDASLSLGWPPQVMTPEVSGGTPPKGQDFNGLAFMITANIQALQAGQPYLYNSTLATAISGYALGTILGMADGTGLWKNIADGNTTDPDAGGAGWVAMYRYGSTPMPGLVGGTVTLTAIQAASSVIVLEGVLLANLQVEFPAQLREWLIVNRTTGPFTTTAKTAAGTGVEIPQGGYAEPTGVYCGDGVNLDYSVGLLTLPSAVAATPDTYVVRDNLGQVYATRFNSDVAPTNPTVGAIVVESDAADGFLQKISIANLVTQMFGARVLASAGMYTLPGGLKIKWGTANAAANATTVVTYPTGGAFTPFTSFSIPIVSGGYVSASAQDNGPATIAATATNFSVYNGLGAIIPFWWIALGV